MFIIYLFCARATHLCVAQHRGVAHVHGGAGTDLLQYTTSTYACLRRTRERYRGILQCSVKPRIIIFTFLPFFLFGSRHYVQFRATQDYLQAEVQVEHVRAGHRLEPWKVLARPGPHFALPAPHLTAPSSSAASYAARLYVKGAAAPRSRALAGGMPHV